MNKFLVFVCCMQVLSVVVGVLVAVFDKKICLSEKCHAIAAIIKERVKSEVNPCEDFYTFACGKLLSKDDVNGTKHDFVEEITKRQSRRVQLLVKEPVDVYEPRAFQLAKKYFQLCQMQDSFYKLLEKLSKLLKELGGFPSVDGDKWNESTWTWMDCTRRLRECGLTFNIFFFIEVQNNPMNTHQFTPWIGNNLYIFGTFTPGYWHQCGDGCKSFYTRWYIDTVIMFGGGRRQAERDADEVFALSVRLAGNMVKNPMVQNDFHESKNDVMTLANLSSTYGFIIWKEYLKIVLRLQSDLPDDIVVVVKNPNYMSSFKQVIEETPPRVLANYMIWTSLYSLSQTVNAPSRDSGVCHRYVTSNMYVAVQAMYLNKYYDPNYVEVVEEMALNIKEEMTNSISQVEWLDDTTRREALDKIHHLRNDLDYPKILLNRTFVDHYYESLSLGDSLSLDATLAVRKFITNKLFDLCLLTFDDKSRDLFIFSIIKLYYANAMYYPVKNSILVLQGMVQSPLFDPYWPAYVNYGRLGSIIGHEITHGFDTQGYHYDGEGQLRNWWTEFSLNHFFEKTRCFVDQFDDFTFFNGSGQQHISGQLSLGENIADTSGAKLSFRAYRKRSDRKLLSEPSLPGLDYTGEQLFFISHAQFFCRAYTVYEYQWMVLSNYAPHKFRSLGTLQNNEYFSEAFGCEQGSKMNPEKKCEIW